MNDTFFVLPPYKPGRGWHFRETYFRVEEAGCAKEGGREGDRQGEVVKYGEGLLLVDEEDHVMCHFRGRKYIRRKPKGTRVGRKGARAGGRKGGLTYLTSDLASPLQSTPFSYIHSFHPLLSP